MSSRGWGTFRRVPTTIRSFIEHCVKEQKRPATVRRYVATIARAHIAAGLLSLCASEPVRMALKEMGRNTGSRQRQALALGFGIVCRTPRDARGRPKGPLLRVRVELMWWRSRVRLRQDIATDLRIPPRIREASRACAPGSPAPSVLRQSARGRASDLHAQPSSIQRRSRDTASFYMVKVRAPL